MTTKTDKALAFIKSAGRPVTNAELAQHLGCAKNAQASMIVSNARLGRITGPGAAEWQNVIVRGKGVYEYRKNGTGRWMAVGEVHGRVVLESPEGHLFAATPLEEILK